MIWLQVNFPVFNIEEYVKRNIQNQFKKVSATLKDWEEKRATRSQPKWTSLRGCLRFSWTCLQVLLKNKRPQRVYFISGRRSFCLPSSIPSPASQVIIYHIIYICIHLFQMDALEGPVWHCPTFLLCDHCREGHPEDLESLPMSQKPKYYRAKCPNVPSRLNQTL